MLKKTHECEVMVDLESFRSGHDGDEGAADHCEAAGHGAWPRDDGGAFSDVFGRIHPTAVHVFWNEEEGLARNDELYIGKDVWLTLCGVGATTCRKVERAIGQGKIQVNARPAVVTTDSYDVINVTSP